jgi:uncharacterized membrane protein YukC
MKNLNIKKVIVLVLTAIALDYVFFSEPEKNGEIAQGALDYVSNANKIMSDLKK